MALNNRSLLSSLALTRSSTKLYSISLVSWDKNPGDSTFFITMFFHAPISSSSRLILGAMLVLSSILWFIMNSSKGLTDISASSWLCGLAMRLFTWLGLNLILFWGFDCVHDMKFSMFLFLRLFWVDLNLRMLVEWALFLRWLYDVSYRTFLRSSRIFSLSLMMSTVKLLLKLLTTNESCSEDSSSILM